MKSFILNDQVEIPSIGLGVYQVPGNGPTYQAVSQALKAGYRHIDTAENYGNEADVGRAVRDSGIDRKEIFVTSKLWIPHYSYEKAKEGIQLSLQKLGLDYVDLYLLHQPYGNTIGAWKALEEAVDDGRIRSIGISNFTIAYLKDFLPHCRILPSVNQMECNPFCQQKALRAYEEPYGIRMEAWYPLGHGNTELLTHELFQELARKYHKSTVQIILRWHVQEGIIAIPKTLDPVHMEDNLNIYDFALTEQEMEEIRSMDTAKPTRDPDDPKRKAYILAIVSPVY